MSLLWIIPLTLILTGWALLSLGRWMQRRLASSEAPAAPSAPVDEPEALPDAPEPREGEMGVLVPFPLRRN